VSLLGITHVQRINALYIQHRPVGMMLRPERVDLLA